MLQKKERMNLKRSEVKFDKQTHTYSLDGSKLSGITPLISEHIMPQKYANIPDHILKAAAERGTKIHSLCSSYNMFEEVSTEYEEVKNYAKLLKSNSITIIEDEYLVNNDRYATMIDNVGSDFSLYDIKTIAMLDTEYLRWQLSIGAHLFEVQNRDLKVPKLFGIWLRGDRAELVEVDRIADEHVRALFKADTEKSEFKNPFKKEIDLNIEELIQVESIIQDLKDHIKDLEEKKQEPLNKVTKQMYELGTKKIETDRITVTVISDTVSKRFDSLKFKNMEPDLYDKFQVESIRKGNIRVKLKL